MNGNQIEGRRATWADVVREELAGTEALWQDLDGLHVGPPPTAAPLTSVVWAWSDDRMVRVRLDGDTAYVAVIPGGSGVRTVVWKPDDGRVASAQLVGLPRGLGSLDLYQVQVDPFDRPGLGPITFMRVQVADDRGVGSVL